jgi:hypothetical protein
MVVSSEFTNPNVTAGIDARLCRVWVDSKCIRYGRGDTYRQLNVTEGMDGSNKYAGKLKLSGMKL